MSQTNPDHGGKVRLFEGTNWLLSPKPDKSEGYRRLFLAERGVGMILTKWLGYWSVWLIGLVLLQGSQLKAQSVLAEQVVIDQARAHWVSADLILLSLPENLRSNQTKAVLYHSYDQDIQWQEQGKRLTGDRINLESSAVPAFIRERFPHLSGFSGYRLPSQSSEKIQRLLQSRLVLGVVDVASQSRVLLATNLQTTGVIDEQFYTDQALGIVSSTDQMQVRFWSPLAQQVNLLVFNPDKQFQQRYPMNQGKTGVWNLTAVPAKQWLDQGWYYVYEISGWHPGSSGGVSTWTVTDPWGVSLAENGLYSQFLDLNAPTHKPQGWDESRLPGINPADISIYEMHIRDFSSGDASVPRQLSGTYGAFALNGLEGRKLSAGMKHLQALQQAGLTHIQTLPASDFGSVNESTTARLDLNSLFSELCTRAKAPAGMCQGYQGKTIAEVFAEEGPESDRVQAWNKWLRGQDGFNWGYDPVHYGIPEGSYASDADGSARVLEFRQMVKGLNDIGLRVSLDVVYNHMMESGLDPLGVLDRAVPGYFHRRDPVTGKIYTSSCCQNTASEHLMMEKLMVDTLKRWADDYHVSAFRFDLMGHHMLSNMKKVQQALGPGIYLYGEGWDFGELKDNPRGVNAIQRNLAGSGIGAFNDRFRDALRGGGVFDCGVLLYQQGILNGLYYDDSVRGGLFTSRVPGADCTKPEDFASLPLADKKAALLSAMDRLRLSLAGSLQSFTFENYQGQTVRGDQVGYGDQAAGWTGSPVEVINYISKHDNQTLFDINQMKLPPGTPMNERVDVQSLGLGVNLMAAGIPFFQFGADLLRSKSLQRDSYDSGDWYNLVDLSLATSRWNRGLPRADKDGINWPFMLPVIRDPSITPDRAAKELVRDRFLDFLKLRYSTPLLRLDDAESVLARMKFHNTGPDQIPGVIAFTMSDESPLVDLDPARTKLLVLINFTKQEVVWNDVPGYQLHALSPSGRAVGDGEYVVTPRSIGVWEK